MNELQKFELNHLLQSAIFVDNHKIIQYRDKKNSNELLKKVHDFKFKYNISTSDFKDYITEFYKNKLLPSQILLVFERIMEN